MSSETVQPWNDPEGETLHTQTQRDSGSAVDSLPALTIAAHPDAGRVGERALLPRSRSTAVGRLSLLFSRPRGGAHRPLESQRISRKHFYLRPQADGAMVLDRGSFSSSLVVDGEPVEQSMSLDAEAVDRGVVLVLARQCVLVLHRVDAHEPSDRDYGMVGHSDGIEAVRRHIEHYADSDKPVLILGESGTGKELVAQAIHRHSRRRSKKLIPVNMGAVNPDLAEAAMFGSVVGAFNGAKDRNGFFQEADAGTLFLDEIGVAGLRLQNLLLRALEQGEVQKVGASRPTKVDVRVVSATDSDLEAAVAEGRFTRPLHGRLSVLCIHMPPLRQRKEDIGPLFVHFLRRELEQCGEAWRLERPPDGRHPWLGAGLMAELLAHSWPTNVRGLKAVAEQIVLHNRDLDRVTRLPDGFGAAGVASRPSPKQPKPKRGDASSIDQETLERALAEHDYEVKATAAQLGVSRSSLHHLIKRHGLPVAKNLSRDDILAAEARCSGDVVQAAALLKVGAKGLKDRRRRLGLSLTRAEILEAIEACCEGGTVQDACLDRLVRHLKVQDAAHLQRRMQDLGIQPET